MTPSSYHAGFWVIGILGISLFTCGVIGTWKQTVWPILVMPMLGIAAAAALIYFANN